MKIILKSAIRKLGSAGDVREVSDGYAMNYLIPKGFAEQATSEAIARAEASAAMRREESERAAERARRLAEQLKGMKVDIEVASRKGKLFGAIRPRDIVEALEKVGVRDIDESDIVLEGAIKKTGTYDVGVRIGERKSVFQMDVRERESV